jgi:hypothetical protein
MGTLICLRICCGFIEARLRKALSFRNPKRQTSVGYVKSMKVKGTLFLWQRCALGIPVATYYYHCLSGNPAFSDTRSWRDGIS